LSPTWKLPCLDSLSNVSTAATPEHSEAESENGDIAEVGVGATLIMKNIPNRYCRSTLLDLLDQRGFQKLYRMVYLPANFATGVKFGYAFVHFSSDEAATRFINEFSGFDDWSSSSEKVCSVDFCSDQCGLDSLIRRYQNCPVMHDLVHDTFRPALFLNGKRLSFPAPTKKVKKPRMDNGHKLA